MPTLAPKRMLIFNRIILMPVEIKNIIIVCLLTGTTLILIKRIRVKNNYKSLKKILLCSIVIITIIIICSQRLLIFILTIELSLTPLCYLIYNESKGEDKEEATKFLIYLNTIGSFPFLALIPKTIRFKERFIHEINLYFNTRWIICLIYLILVLVKTPIIIFHIWLRKAHVRASRACSIILASILIKIGTYGILKFNSLINETFKKSENIWISISIFTLIILPILMIRYFDLKTIIALSSVAHIRFIRFILIIGTIRRNYCIVIIIRGHGIISFFIFYLIRLKYETSENRTRSLIKSEESWTKTISILSTIFLFINIGVPPLISFIREITLVIIILNWSKIITIIIIAYLIESVIVLILVTTNLLYGKKERKIIKETKMKELRWGTIIRLLSLYILLTL